MSTLPRVVSWANRDEWIEIYRCLYSFDDINLQRKGVDRVLAWKSRSSGKLSMSIECTVDLISAHLVDSVSSNTEVQLVLSMALVRFVNSMVDKKQKGLYARPVHAIAKEIGIPVWMVDLRHEATHADLPSRHTLITGVHVALSWLREKYWEPQMMMYKDSEEKLCQMLDSYQIRCSKKRKNKEKQERKLKKLAQEITDFVSNNNLWRFLQELLLRNGLTGEYQDLDSTTSGQALTAIYQVPDTVIKLWNPLFEALDNQYHDFVPFFLVSILDPQSNDLKNDMPNKNHLMPWAFLLLKFNSSFKSKLPWLTLLEVCLKNPNPFTREFVTLILEEMPCIPDSLKQSILSLVTIKFFEYSFENNYDDVYECRTLQQILNNRTVEQPSQGDYSVLHTGWSASKGKTKWNLIPFGEILGCEYQSTNLLELPEDFVTQKEISTGNFTCRNFVEDSTEVVNEYGKNEQDDRMSTDTNMNCNEDVVMNESTCNNDSIFDEEVNDEGQCFDTGQLKTRICLF